MTSELRRVALSARQALKELTELSQELGLY